MPLASGFFRRPAIGLAILLTAFGAWATADWYRTVPDDALQQAHYVGRESCVACHQAEAKLWTGSNHDRAMEVATDETVLGDFSNAQFSRFGEQTRFFRDGAKFMVNAEGPDGAYHDYEIKYTFGINPLQQYMVEFPDGRLQVLRVSWDVDEKKWFYVAPTDATDERIEAGDPLHWTGLAQNWNTMCAECHTTDYHKNYDLATNTYHSEYFEIDVSCEACHGPGSLHVELANRRSLFWDRKVRYGLTNTLKGATTQQQMETCAPCHSRRSIIHPDYRPGDSYLDHFEPSLLDAGLYHADGQILDEVFEMGSFTQSKMFHKGVRCTDCHDPHSLKLKFEGNRLCAQCHQPGIYDGPAHNHHPNAAPGSPETQCVTCHMPTTTYMGIDERRDHSIRVPRPDLSVTLGTPNVCNRCHTKPHETAQWAADRVVEWYGPKRPDDPNHAAAFALAQRGEPQGEELLRELLERETTSDIVRASAIELLRNYPGEKSIRLRNEAMSHPSPLVRAAAVRSFATDSPVKLVRDVGPKLDDRSRAVRLAAANRLIADAQELASSEFSSSLNDAVKDYRAGQSLHLDRAPSNRNLANLSLQLGDTAAAVNSLRTAIRLESYLTGPRTELSQLLDKLALDPAQAETLVKVNGSPEEIKRLREEEVELLRRDAKLLPTDPTPRYMRGRLLFLLGHEDEARQAFIEACELGPNVYEYWLWLALICERQERWEQAVKALQRMAQLQPQADDWKGILMRIRETIAAQGGTLSVVTPEQAEQQPAEKDK